MRALGAFLPSAIPTMPDDEPKITNLTNDTVTLSWKPSPDESVTYTIEVMDVNGDWITAKEDVTDVTCTLEGMWNANSH